MSVATTNPSPCAVDTNFPFLKLPVELRCIIYAEYIASTVIFYNIEWRRQHRNYRKRGEEEGSQTVRAAKRSKNLFQVCRLIRHELEEELRRKCTSLQSTTFAQPFAITAIYLDFGVGVDVLGCTSRTPADMVHESVIPLSLTDDNEIRKRVAEIVKHMSSLRAATFRIFG
jgi:hypothetical protein